MPFITVQVFEGRTVDEKRKLASEVTKAVCSSLGVPPETVRITISDLPKENLSVGGTLFIDKA